MRTRPIYAMEDYGRQFLRSLEHRGARLLCREIRRLPVKEMLNELEKQGYSVAG